MIDLPERVYKKLLDYDPDIIEIVQFGSSVYAPEQAKDIDLLIITKKPKDYYGYLDAVESIEPPIGIDVIIVKPNTKLREELLRGIIASSKIVYGDGKHVLELAKNLGDPTFDEAKAALRVAYRLLKLALETVDPLEKDRLIREAFNTLFHAARIAAMTYLSTEVARWGIIGKKLPKPHQKTFKKFINILHIEFFYHGRYPMDDVEKEFNKWYRKVEKFINKLENEIKIA